MTVDRDLPVPLYEQVADELRRSITSGALAPGAALPPESTLIATFAVSRVTARKALDILVDDGLIVRKQGKGSFVAPPKIQQDLHSLRGFAEVMAERGQAQTMEVQEFGMVPADHRVSRALGVGIDDHVLRINRRHLLSGEPIAFAVIYLPARLGTLLTFDDVSATPIYTLLEHKAQVEIKRATQVVRAIPADPLISRYLGVRRLSPVMMIERVTYSTTEQPVEFILFWYRGDRYELAIELFRDPIHNVLQPMDSVTSLVHPV
jgi:GntR family transcriptional regulator